jgi:hypothetical protein
MVLAMQKNKNNAERNDIEAVRYLLRQWVRWKRRWRPALGYPRGVPYLDGILGAIDSYTEGEDYDDRIEATTVRAIDQAVENDLTAMQRLALMLRYMNELGPSVWRSNRVPHEQARRIADEAEIALIPALRRRDVAV